MAEEAILTFRFVDGGGTSAPAAGARAPSTAGSTTAAVNENPAGNAADKAQERSNRQQARTAGTAPGKSAGPIEAKQTTALEAIAGAGKGLKDVLGAMSGQQSMNPFDLAQRAAAVGRGTQAVIQSLGKIVPPTAGQGASAAATGGGAGGLATAGVGVAGTAARAGVAGARGAGTLAGAAGGGAGAAGAAVAGTVGAAVAIGLLPHMAGLAALAGAQRLADSSRERLANISPELAQASAEAELRQLRADFRRNRMLGSEIARNVETGSAVNDELSRMGDLLAGPWLTAVNDIKEISAGSLRAINDGIEMARPFYEAAANNPFSIFTSLRQIADLLENMRQAREKFGDGNMLLWFDAQPHIAPPGWDADAGIRPAAGEVAFNHVPGLNL